MSFKRLGNAKLQSPHMLQLGYAWEFACCCRAMHGFPCSCCCKLLLLLLLLALLHLPRCCLRYCYEQLLATAKSEPRGITAAYSACNNCAAKVSAHMLPAIAAAFPIAMLVHPWQQMLLRL
jgi:hypothetical protein